MGLYIGLSFILQWRLRYGECEVKAMPVLLLGRRCRTYCIPLIAADAVEKAVVKRPRNTHISNAWSSREEIWSSLVTACMEV